MIALAKRFSSEREGGLWGGGRCRRRCSWLEVGQYARGADIYNAPAACSVSASDFYFPSHGINPYPAGRLVESATYESFI